MPYFKAYYFTSDKDTAQKWKKQIILIFIEGRNPGITCPADY